MIWLYRQINEVRAHAQWAAMRGKVLTPENMRLYDRQHAAVVEAVRRRDADARWPWSTMRLCAATIVGAVID